MASEYIFSEDFDFAEEFKDVEDQVFPDDESKVQNLQKENEEEWEKESPPTETTTSVVETTSSDVKTTDCNIDINTTALFKFELESQPLVPTLEELAHSGYIHNRQLASKKILEFLHEAETKEELQSILEIMCKLSDDEEVMVRSELMEHIPSIALFCKQHDTDLGVVIRQQLVPYTVKLLSDNQIQVRKVGHSSLIVLLENNLIDHAQLSEWICPLIAQLAISENDAKDLKTEDVSVMCKMIPLVGKEIVLKFFLEPFISLCCDSALAIRKICASSCGILGKAIETEPTESTLLPAFYSLCDDGCWGVRKACADVIIDIATVVTPEKRKNDLSLIYLTLLNDNSQSVRNAAYQSLGGFIATFADPSETELRYECGTWVKTERSKSYNLNSCHAIDESSKELNNDEKCVSDCKGSSNFRKNNCSVFSNSEQLDRNRDNNQVNDVILTNSDVCPKFGTRCCSQDFESGNRNFYDRSILYSYMQDKNSVVSEMSLDELYEEFFVSAKKKKCTPSVALQTKHRHVPFRVANESLFNDFQFWKIPVPEVELDIDFDEGNSTQTLVQATAHHENEKPSATDFDEGNPTQTHVQATARHENEKPSATEVKVQVAPDSTSASESSSVTEQKLPKLHFLTSANVTDSDDGSKNLHDVKERIVDPSIEVEELWFSSACRERRENLIFQKQFIKRSEGENRKMFDSPYSQDIVPPEILGKFVNLHFEDLCEQIDDERALHCAFSFPAVAYTLGRQHWPVLKQLCYNLAHNVKWTVRRTIASSLHELAVFLGNDIVIKDLLPIIFSLLADIDEVRLKVIRHLPEFLKHLEPRERREFLPTFEDFLKVDNDRNWRFRHTVAEQLVLSVELFNSSDVYDFFLPVATTLIEDKVSDVRKAAVELVAVIIKSLSQDEETAKYPRHLLAQFDVKYKRAHRWIVRQMYVLLCEQIAVKKSVSTDTFVEEIVPNLFSLAWDSVPNVRLAVSRCIAQTLLPLDYLPCIQKTHYQLLLQVMYSLQSDVDKDVRHFAYLSAGSFKVVPQKKLSPV